eukprot:10716266-Alexandrium_andersonii.AAC.1
MRVAEGYPDPLVGKPRLWLALKGLARLQSARPRKFPAAAQMLKWLKDQYDIYKVPDHAVMWGALLLAWFFLMRLTEYAWSGRWDLEKVLTGADVAARSEGKAVTSFAQADEVMVWFKASKADQLKF